MRQLVLVDEFRADPAALALHVARTTLPTTPVVAFDSIDWALPAMETGAAEFVDRLEDLPGDIFVMPEADAKTAVVVHEAGRFPDRLDDDARMRLAACDTVIARCPRRDFVLAAQFYSHLLYALDGQLVPSRLRSATAHLLGLVDRARNEAARRRHDLLDDEAPERSYAPAGTAVHLSNLMNDDKAQVETSIFSTAYGEISVEMARIGFEISSRKVREGRSALTILVGSPGIAIYGPYVALEEGDYCFRLELEGGDRDVAFTLEAAWNAGSQILAVHRYAYQQVGRAYADLHFSVPGPAAGRALELRLWNDADSAAFDVVRLSLAALAEPW